MPIYQTTAEHFTVRDAAQDDVPLILDFIRSLAEYEKLLHEVVADEETLRKSLFEKGQAKVLIGELGNEPVAFALYFYNFSTFLGKANLYLEDLYVKPEYRGRKLGRAMFEVLAKIAVQEACERLDWWCLDWNESSIAFYRRMGAVPMDDWTVYRLQGEALRKLGATEI